jgi:hypothetical protein
MSAIGEGCELAVLPSLKRFAHFHSVEDAGGFHRRDAAVYQYFYYVGARIGSGCQTVLDASLRPHRHIFRSTTVQEVVADR